MYNIQEKNGFHNVQSHTNTIHTCNVLQQSIFYSTGVKFHITHIRKIMHQYGISAKSAQKYHINHASISAVRSWQQRIKKRILRLEKSGFVIAMTDEAFFIRDVKTGRKYWSLDCQEDISSIHRTT